MKTPHQASMEAALAEGRRLARRRRDILAVGIGIKHSRRYGYGGSPTAVVKFLVRAKRPDVPPNQLVPRRLKVWVDGRVWRVPTDVEELGPIARHAQIQAAEPGMPGFHGTPGFFVRSAAAKHYLVTAGHVLFNARDENPWPVSPVHVYANDALVGWIDTRNTYYKMAGLRMDVGLVELAGDGYVASLDAAPWNGMSAHVGPEALRSLVIGAGAPAVARIFGRNSSPEVVLDGLYEQRLRLDGLFDDTGAVEDYAPTMIQVRVRNGTLARGDSGAPLITSDGRVAGMHLLGWDQDSSVGWSIATESVLRSLGARLGTSLAVVPCRRPTR